MTIVRFKPGMDVPAGKFVCPEHPAPGGLCLPPRKIMRVAGQRLHFHTDAGEEKFMLLKSVAFVCDTDQEGMSVYALGMERWSVHKKALEYAQAKVYKEYNEKLDDLIGGVQ